MRAKGVHSLGESRMAGCRGVVELMEKAATEGEVIGDTNAVMKVPQIIAEGEIGGAARGGKVWIVGVASLNVVEERIIKEDVDRGKGGQGRRRGIGDQRGGERGRGQRGRVGREVQGRQRGGERGRGHRRGKWGRRGVGGKEGRGVGEREWRVGGKEGGREVGGEGRERGVGGENDGESVKQGRGRGGVRGEST